MTKGAWSGGFVLDDHPASGINAYLAIPGRTIGNPHRLSANAGKAFQGTIVLGKGFVLDEATAQHLLSQDNRNRDVLQPYLVGDDVNSRPDQSPSRWVINFHDWSLERASTYDAPFRIVESKVKPERMTVTYSSSAKKFWWRYERPRTDLYRAIEEFEEVLVSCRHTKYVTHAYVRSDAIFDVALNVFTESDPATFLVLESSIYGCWCAQYGSSLGATIRYTLADCYETFPFPRLSGIDCSQLVTELLSSRSMWCEQNYLGLTDLYNHLHVPDTVDGFLETAKRAIQRIDQLMAKGYGWDDLDLEHGFHETKQGVRFTISERARREVLDRLLELNHQRYAEEVEQGLHDKGSKRRKKPASSQKGLF